MSIKNLYNTRKKKTIIAISSLVLLFLILTGIYLFPFTHIKDDLKNSIKDDFVSWKEDRVKDYEIVLCKFDLKNPEYVLVQEISYYSNPDNSYFEIAFYQPKRDGIFIQEWTNIETRQGRVEISNTTFSSLVDLIKDDCDQFKQNHNGYTGADPNGTTWLYYPPPTEQEIAEQEQHQQDIKDRIKKKIEEGRGIYLMKNEYLEIYNNLTEEELALANQKMESGELKDDYDLALWFKQIGKTNLEINEEYLFLGE